MKRKKARKYRKFKTLKKVGKFLTELRTEKNVSFEEMELKTNLTKQELQNLEKAKIDDAMVENFFCAYSLRLYILTLCYETDETQKENFI